MKLRYQNSSHDDDYNRTIKKIPEGYYMGDDWEGYFYYNSKTKQWYDLGQRHSPENKLFDPLNDSFDNEIQTWLNKIVYLGPDFYSAAITLAEYVLTYERDE